MKTLSSLLILGLLVCSAAQAASSCFNAKSGAIGFVRITENSVLIMWDIKESARMYRESGWTQSFKETSESTKACLLYTSPSPRD